MLAEIVTTVNSWINQAGPPALVGAFVWGMISVLFSPCHLASIPLMIAYVGGQRELLGPSQAARYALCFAAGLFVTIAGVGVSCVFLGRMLGDIGPYWKVPVGLLLLWVGYGLFKGGSCSMGGMNFLNRFQIRGLTGALILGLAYGFLSGLCTFGFIAPILGIIALQQKMMIGILMILLFAAGHCLPLIAATTFSAGLRRALVNHRFQQGAEWFRRVAALLVIGLGVYFLLGG